MVTQGERLEQLMDAYDLTQSEFAKRMNIPKSSLSLYVSNKRKMRQNRIKKISDEFKIDEAWLLGYDVPMKKDIVSFESVNFHDDKVTTEMIKSILEKRHINKETQEIVDAYINLDFETRNMVRRLLNLSELKSNSMGESSNSENDV